MDLSVLFKRVGRVAVDNSPAILTAIGVTGAVAGAYLAAKGGMEAVGLLKEAEENKKAEFLGETKDQLKYENPDIEPLTFEEKFNATWKCFAPAVGCVVLSATTVICANRISDRRAAAFASAYSIVEKAYAEHRSKVVEKVGKKKEQEIRDEIAAERMERHPFGGASSIIVATGHGTTRCYDIWNDRYFTSDMESLRKAVNDFNQEVINSTYGSMTDFYHLLDLPSTGHSDDFGWDTDKLLELDFSSHLHPDGTPCIAIDFKTKPNPRFSRLY